MTAALHSTRPGSPFDRLLLQAGLALVAWSRRRSSRVASLAEAPNRSDGDPFADMLVRDGIRHTTFR
ncbi:hypothetical protein EDF46_1929 [Frondihabitans sp. PhB188]|uniref:hypothetical protein n=1 Tax=Frondihabitans sp. PhB188 TaxID=2485200 RepID=UPI000F480C8A|nr:hypothetical protein [Frondihabitans sp. PhB188]ROQ38302.1 hypothetical protein EDF46_1929 [Frondihabitans sp. PhB188]